jgi:hypothetical protein
MKLSTLKKQAQGATTWRGHRIVWGQAYGRANGPQSLNGQCRKCGAYVFLVEHPNSIGVSGLAVAVNCDNR